MEEVLKTNTPDIIEQQATEELLADTKQENVEQVTSEELLEVSRQKIIRKTGKVYKYTRSKPNRVISAYPCKDCKRKFEAEDVLKVHSHTHYAIGTYPPDCPLCGLVFHNGTYLPQYLEMNFKKHINVHTKECIRIIRKTKYICKVCGKHFNTGRGLEKHKLSHNKKLPEIKLGKYIQAILEPPIKGPENIIQDIKDTLVKSFSCETCNRKFETTDILEIHSHEHYKRHEFPTSCPVCDFIFTCKPSLSNREVDNFVAHIKLHIKSRRKAFRDEMNTCNECGKVAPTPKELLRHMQKHTASHKCTRCGQVFKTDVNLQKHTRFSHTKYKCKICDAATFDRQCKIKEHLQQCRKARRTKVQRTPKCSQVQCNTKSSQLQCSPRSSQVQCSPCEMSFSSHKAHAEPQLEHSDDMKCQHCSRMISSCSWYEHLQQHIAPIVCEFCSALLPATDMIAHLWIHGRQFRCQLCGQQFEKTSYRDDHLREHLQYTALDLAEAKITKVFPCKICNQKWFNDRTKLLSHVSTHMEKSICCNCCEKYFTYYRYLAHRRKQNQQALNSQKESLEKTFEETELEDPLHIEMSTEQPPIESTIKIEPEDIHYPDLVKVEPVFVDIKQEPMDL